MKSFDSFEEENSKRRLTLNRYLEIHGWWDFFFWKTSSGLKMKFLWIYSQINALLLFRCFCEIFTSLWLINILKYFIVPKCIYKSFQSKKLFISQVSIDRSSSRDFEWIAQEISSQLLHIPYSIVEVLPELEKNARQIFIVHFHNLCLLIKLSFGIFFFLFHMRLYAICNFICIHKMAFVHKQQQCHEHWTTMMGVW